MKTMKRTALETLEADLRAMIEPERANFVELVYGQFKRVLDSFLEERKPNLYLEEVYTSQYFRFTPDGLREATNYYEESAKIHQQLHYRPIKPEVRPHWEVGYKPGAKKILRHLAETVAEDYINTFLTRALEKLGPVVERKPNYKASKPESVTFTGRFEGGAWTGYLLFEWLDSVKFVAKLKIITNFSVRGKAFAQYPMTFHNCALDPTAEQEGRLGLASIEQIWESVGYAPPKKPEGPPRKRWAKLVSGSVVEVNGRPVLLHTAGEGKKLGVPADAPQIARLEAWATGARLERVDGTTASFKYDLVERDKFIAVEQDYNLKSSYAVASRMRQDYAFAEFFKEVTV